MACALTASVAGVWLATADTLAGVLLWALGIAGFLVAVFWLELTQRLRLRDALSKCEELERVTSAQGVILAKHGELFDRIAMHYAWSRDPADANPLNIGKTSGKTSGNKPEEPLRFAKLRRMHRSDE